MVPGMKYDPADPKYDDLIYAVGTLSVWFNLLESHLLDETWQVVAQGPDMGHLVTDRMNVSRVIDLLVDAYQVLVPAREKELKQLRKDLQAVNKKRNMFVHATWAPGSDPNLVIKGTKVAKRTQGWVGPEVESTHDLATQIAEVHKTLGQIRHLIGRVVDLHKMLPARGQPRT